MEARARVDVAVPVGRCGTQRLDERRAVHPLLRHEPAGLGQRPVEPVRPQGGKPRAAGAGRVHRRVAGTRTTPRARRTTAPAARPAPRPPRRSSRTPDGRAPRSARPAWLTATSNVWFHETSAKSGLLRRASRHSLASVDTVGVRSLTASVARPERRVTARSTTRTFGTPARQPAQHASHVGLRLHGHHVAPQRREGARAIAQVRADVEHEVASPDELSVNARSRRCRNGMRSRRRRASQPDGRSKRLTRGPGAWSPGAWSR